MKLSKVQTDILDASGHILVQGGPGSGKTTIAIQKAGQHIRKLDAAQRVLFLSFARATVTRVVEAIGEQKTITPKDTKRIEVATYHSFFWQIIKTHGYLLGLPRRLSLLSPHAQAVALAPIRSEYGQVSKLNSTEKAQKKEDEKVEKSRLAIDEGRVSFDLFAQYAADLVQRSVRIRKLVANACPLIILDEFQDTNADQWRFVKSMGSEACLVALADPEQRIFDFIGADPARIGQFRSEFKPKEFNLKSENYRSPGTDIARFGNDVLSGAFKYPYTGLTIKKYGDGVPQAWTALSSATLGAIQRLKKRGKGWSLAVLVPTKSLARGISDAFRAPPGTMPPIHHSAVIDMEGATLAAEVIAYSLQPASLLDDLGSFVGLVANYFHGRGGDDPTLGDLGMADKLLAALSKHFSLQARGKALPANSILVPIIKTHSDLRAMKFTGKPDRDWLTVRTTLEGSGCPRLREVASDAKYLRLLEKGVAFSQSLAADWRANGYYGNALELTREAFAQEHLAAGLSVETGVVIMNMHKAKGKQFDEVIIFDGWPIKSKGKIVANPDRILRGNELGAHASQARQNLRVSVTRAKLATVILTPNSDPCALIGP